MNWSHPAYEKIAQLLKARTGLYFSEKRREEAEMGIERVMKRAGVAAPERFAAMIAGDGRIIDDLVVEMAVTESYFFREPRQFEMIRNEVLPEIRGNLGAEHQIRAWSAGCAAGEEPYSLAIIFDQEGLSDRAYILATDISRPALDQARQATYDAWAVRDGALELSRGRLHLRDGVYVVADRPRRLVKFQHHNLALDVYPSDASGVADMDLILCRNVLIYFDSPTIQFVADRLFETLAPGGWLITASTDPPLAGLTSFETVETSAGIAYRRPSTTERRQLRRAGNTAAATRREPAPRAALAVVPAAAAPQQAAPVDDDSLSAAEAAFAAGDYRLAARLAARQANEPESCILRVRAEANFDPALAERTCSSALDRHALSPALHYLHALLLIGQGRDGEAIEELRQVIYLDRTQPLACFTLGSVLQRRGDLPAARREYRNAWRLCGRLPPDACVPLSEAECAGRLSEAAAARMEQIDAVQELQR